MYRKLISRRMFTTSLLGASSSLGFGLPGALASVPRTEPAKAPGEVFFIGAMPWVRLFNGEQLECWASMAWADWSPHGTGRVLVLRQGNQRRTLGDNEALATWLGQWLEPSANDDGAERSESFEQSVVEVDLDLDSGLCVTAGNIRIEMSEPIDRQLIHRSPYPLGDFHPTASWVRISCARAHILVDDEPMPGKPKVSTDAHGPLSTAQINVAEVWTT